MRRNLIVYAIATCVASGCGDSTGPEAKLSADVAATWTASQACAPPCTFTLTAIANPQATTDLLFTGGLTLRLELRRDGTAILSGLGATTIGTAKQSGTMLILTSGTSVDTVDYAVVDGGTTLDLDFRTTFNNFDFTGDGIADPAKAHAVLKKQ